MEEGGIAPGHRGMWRITCGDDDESEEGRGAHGLLGFVIAGDCAQEGSFCGIDDTGESNITTCKV